MPGIQRHHTLGARTLGAPGLTTRSKNLLGAKGMGTMSKDATSNSSHSLQLRRQWRMEHVMDYMGSISCSVLSIWHTYITKASMLAEFFFALAMLWWEGLRALKIDISS